MKLSNHLLGEISQKVIMKHLVSMIFSVISKKVNISASTFRSLLSILTSIGSLAYWVAEHASKTGGNESITNLIIKHVNEIQGLNEDLEARLYSTISKWEVEATVLDESVLNKD